MFLCLSNLRSRGGSGQEWPMSKKKTTDLGNSTVVLTDELVDPNIARGTMLMRSLVIHETEKEMHRDDQWDQWPSGVKGIDSSRLSST